MGRENFPPICCAACDYNFPMPNPVAEWIEDDVLALPPGENDGFERKGKYLLDLTIPKVKVDDVLNAKQLSVPDFLWQAGSTSVTGRLSRLRP